MPIKVGSFARVVAAGESSFPPATAESRWKAEGAEGWSWERWESLAVALYPVASSVVDIGQWPCACVFVEAYIRREFVFLNQLDAP